MLDFEALRKYLAQYLEIEKIKQIEKAYLVSEKAHSGQKRRTGEPYIIHPLAVAKILAEMRLDHESIMAAILHDVLEDTDLSKQYIAENFGEVVADLVDGVSKLTQIKFQNIAEQQAENFRKMLLAMVQDIRVILVKLADRLHNMRTLDALPATKRKRISRETLEIYAPIANRLGMNNFRVEFEDLGFKAFYPLRSKILQDSVKKARGNRKEITDKIAESIKQGLEKKGIDSKSLHGREKHLYSIYKKMRNKHLSFSQIMDFYAFRIIVDSIDECYLVLGAVHSLFKPVPGRFKDYIAIPKANNYQSLHTTLFGPYGVPIEIQIRTKEMHRIAERGIAAHWLYKSPEASMTEAQEATRSWLSGLIEMQRHEGTPYEFMQNVKIDLFPDEVYVFTPKGDIMELPSGATSVDFAYAVHTAVGNSCIAAKIDRQLAPLSMPLESGQTVEIITANGAKPNTSWLNFVVTGKARSNIRYFLKNQQREESISLGHRLLENSLAATGITLDECQEEIISKLLQENFLNTMDDMFFEIGLGNRTAILVARRIFDLQNSIGEQQGKESLTTKPLVITGTQGLAVTFAKCCWPIPGDHIIGILSFGKGLTVHVEACKNIFTSNEKDKEVITLCWAKKLDREFQVEIKIEVINGRGILASIAASIAGAEANIDFIRSEEQEGGYAVVTVILAVKGKQHLEQVIRRLNGLRSIVKVSR